MENNKKQMDLPYDDFVDKKPHESAIESEEEFLVEAGHEICQSDIAKSYLKNRSEQDKLEDDCPICGGSGPCYRCRRR